jgi:hypothetical protein
MYIAKNAKPIYEEEHILEPTVDHGVAVRGRTGKHVG